MSSGGYGGSARAAQATPLYMIPLRVKMVQAPSAGHGASAGGAGGYGAGGAGGYGAGGAGGY